jgi:tetratricopeptide (TPR) repeat protein
VLRGRAYEREAMPYKAIDGVIDALSRYLICLDEEELAAVLPADAWTIARLFPVLRRIPAIDTLPGESITDPQRARRRAFRALRELFASLARRRPLVLFIDDVHWGDTDSAALLLELARPPDAPLLLLAMTYRDEQEPTSAFLGELKAGWPRQAEMRDLAVGPLEPVHARRLAQMLLASDDRSTDGVADAIAREADGNPFLIEELARNVVSRSSAPARASVITGQTTLEEMVSDRLSQLPQDARRCLELIAVSGRPVPMAVASAAAELQQTPEETLVLLRARRFVRSGMRDGREVVEVVHDRIRETIMGQLSSENVRESHARLARSLESAPDPDVEALATHLFGAGDGDRAVRFAEQAADQAATKLAFDQAAHLLRLAIAALPKSATDELRLRKRLGEFLELAGRSAEAGRVYLEAVEAAPAAEKLDLRRAAAEQLHASGLMDEGTRVLREVLATMRVWAPRSPVTAVIWYLLHLLWLRFTRLHFREREISPEQRRRIDTLNAVALGFALVDHILAVAMKARLLVVAMRAGDRMQTARGAALAALDVSGYTGPESRIEHDLRELARRLAQTPAAKFTLAVSNGMSLHYRGRFREAKEALDPLQATVTNRRVGVHTAVLFTLHSIQFLGEMADLTDRYTRALADAEERGNLFMSVALRTSTAASVWLAADDPDRARRELREAMAQWGQKKFSSPEWRAIVSETEVDLYVGDGASAYERVRGLSHALVRNCFFVYHTRVLVAFAQGRAAVASVHGLRGSDRRARLKEARRWARVLKTKRMAWTAPLASILEAAVALVDGREEEAQSALRATIEGAAAADLALHAAAARHQLGVLLAGDEGTALVREADEAMTSPGIRMPARFPAMLVPSSAR